MMMVNIREVWVFVVDWRVSMPMRMRLRWIHFCFVLMLVVLILLMGMRVLYGLVNMVMLVSLGQVQPYPQPHECRGQPKRRGCSFSKKYQRNDSPNKWRC